MNGRSARRALALLVTLATGAAGSAVAQEAGEAPSFKDVIELNGVGGVAVAPDGSAVAYTVRSADWDGNRFDTEIWLARAGEEPFQLTRTADGSSSAPEWSPDGRWIAFLANRGEGNQVHLVRATGGEAFPLTSVEDGVSDYHWSPNGARMALEITDPLSEEREAIQEQYGDFAVEDAEGRNTHLWLVEVAPDGTASEPEQLTEGDFTVTSVEWAPDGTRIALAHQPDPGINGFFGSDVSVLDVESGSLTAIADGPGPESSPVWSPDGAWLLYGGSEGDLGSLYYTNSVLFRVPATGGEPESLLDGFDEDVGGVNWTDAGIRFVASARTERRIYQLDPGTRQITHLAVDLPIVGAVDHTPDGGTIAFTAQSDVQLNEVYVATVDGPAVTVHAPVTSMTDQIDGWAIGTREVITWRSRDGAEIEGVLWKPDDYDPNRRYPLMVAIHGGPTGTSRPLAATGYVYPLLQWVEKGAVVLQPNYRGSAGYGEAFRSLNVRNLGVGDMWDVMSGVDHLIDEGVADPERLAAMGWSQGGYISAFLTTNTDRFKAISVGAGISNWMTYYVNTDIHPFTRQYLKGTPWDDPEVYAKTSPMTAITGATTPTLIQHGEFDRRVPIPNAYELFQGLQDQGVETSLIVYNGFGHGINKPKELLAASWHNWIWFGKHIWGEELDMPVDRESPVAADPEEGGNR